MQFETPAYTILVLYQIPSGLSSKNRDLYKSVSMPYSQPLVGRGTEGVTVGVHDIFLYIQANRGCATKAVNSH
jgi:hypothetical protein